MNREKLALLETIKPQLTELKYKTARLRLEGLSIPEISERLNTTAGAAGQCVRSVAAQHPGLELIKPGGYIPPEYEHIYRLYKEDIPIFAIANQFNKTRDIIFGILTTVAIRKGESFRPQQRKTHIREEKIEIARLLIEQEGANKGEASAVLGIPAMRLKSFKKNTGIKYERLKPILPKLSPLQYERVRLLMNGMTAKAVARRYGITHQAVESTVAHADHLLASRELWVKWLTEVDGTVAEDLFWLYAKYLDGYTKKEIAQSEGIAYYSVKRCIANVEAAMPQYRRLPSMLEWKRGKHDASDHG